jgi:hypothetical protein
MGHRRCDKYFGQDSKGVILSVFAKDLVDALKARAFQSLIGNGRAFHARAGCFMSTFSMTPFALFKLARKFWPAHHR